MPSRRLASALPPIARISNPQRVRLQREAVEREADEAVEQAEMDARAAEASAAAPRRRRRAIADRTRFRRCATVRR